MLGHAQLGVVALGQLPVLPLESVLTMNALEQGDVSSQQIIVKKLKSARVAIVETTTVRARTGIDLKLVR